MEKGKNQQIAAIVDRAEALLLDEAVEAALAHVQSGLENHDHVRLWRIKRRILTMLGEEAEAAALMRRIVHAVHAPTPGELALAGSDKSAFTRLASHRILYLHIPKCGSTTIKDMLYFIATGNRGEGHAHTLVAKHAPYAYVDRRTLGATHPGWFKFLVVRDPVARLRSYYRFNLVFANDLAKEVPGRQTYLGLKLQPSYDEFLRDLPRYRQVFRTLRAHTNPISDIAGDDAAVFDWVGPTGKMDALRARLGAWARMDIPAIHNFKSAEMASIEPNAGLEALARERYARDYQVYGAYF